MLTKREASIELAKRRARVDLLSFMRFCWDSNQQFLVGRHTREICNRLTMAVDDWLLKDKSTFLNIAVPFRHGKSMIVSTYFPAYFIGRATASGKDPSTILSGYSGDFILGFSNGVNRLIDSPRYKIL